MVCFYKAVKLNKAFVGSATFTLRKCMGAKSLRELEINHSEITPLNYLACRARYVELADIIYARKGWGFMREYFSMQHEFSIRGASGKEIEDVTIKKLKDIDPEVHLWFESMHNSNKPYILFAVLFVAIMFMLVLSKRIKSIQPVAYRLAVMIVTRLILYTSIFLLVVQVFLFYLG
jgi:hypothetical protein